MLVMATIEIDRQGEEETDGELKENRGCDSPMEGVGVDIGIVVIIVFGISEKAYETRDVVELEEDIKRIEVRGRDMVKVSMSNEDTGVVEVRGRVEVKAPVKLEDEDEVEVEAPVKLEEDDVMILGFQTYSNTMIKY
ncbi:uncharacterized protein A4U43_C07F19860 [Asparagus officinalis]|uniref:Uncharacterized protein n=1 Tax=Asparagus officinalis TaxID=4686 RepID=A0A5P1EDC5_ASPOF|nr:uncharacterized protein A4U43_C07F19860 [Asparagus officinalis]